MNTSYNPERGFFVGKMSTHATCALAAAAVLAVFAPAAIRADTDVGAAPKAPAPAVAVAAPAGNPRLVWITAYASVPEQTSDHPFITASGALVRDGIVAANFLPFGARIKVPKLFGDKIFSVKDRMNRKFSKRVDIWMPTVEDAVNFGIHRAAIVVLGPAPDPDLAVAK